MRFDAEDHQGSCWFSVPRQRAHGTHHRYLPQNTPGAGYRPGENPPDDWNCPHHKSAPTRSATTRTKATTVALPDHVTGHTSRAPRQHAGPHSRPYRHNYRRRTGSCLSALTRPMLAEVRVRRSRQRSRAWLIILLRSGGPGHRMPGMSGGRSGWVRSWPRASRNPTWSGGCSPLASCAAMGVASTSR